MLVNRLISLATKAGSIPTIVAASAMLALSRRSPILSMAADTLDAMSQPPLRLIPATASFMSPRMYPFLKGLAENVLSLTGHNALSLSPSTHTATLLGTCFVLPSSSNASSISFASTVSKAVSVTSAVCPQCEYSTLVNPAFTLLGSRATTSLPFTTLYTSFIPNDSKCVTNAVFPTRGAPKEYILISLARGTVRVASCCLPLISLPHQGCVGACVGSPRPASSPY
mmetsp:Transcript_14274/g.19680  ORF Transcript_14274/g.19680 Transcript_14274/m.19680 type:complete len:226 (+) Transcript_14274:207-884(+)